MPRRPSVEMGDSCEENMPWQDEHSKKPPDHSRRGLLQLLLTAGIIAGSGVASSCTSREDGHKNAKAAKSVSRVQESLEAQKSTPTEEGMEHVEVPEGFTVERVADHALTGSLINMTFDQRYPVVARERGGVFILKDENGDGVYDRADVLTAKVVDCHGVAAIGGRVYYLVGKHIESAEGLQGRPGLYRLTKSEGREKLELVLLLDAEMLEGIGVEHGAQAVIARPDGTLYLLFGDHARLAPPPMEETVDQKENGNMTKTKPQRVHGGSIWQVDPERKTCRLVTNGVRNAFDGAFNKNGDLFVADNDMEGEINLPERSGRSVRVYQCMQGADFGSRSGEANFPPYYVDSLPGVVSLGEGAPTGMVCYEQEQFPERYRGALFIADWQTGSIFAVHLHPQGATYTGTVEEFARGLHHVTDIAIGPDGALYCCTGGRGKQGGVIRISFQGQKTEASQQATATNMPDSGASALAKRQMLETHLRSGTPAALDVLLPLLASEDRFVRYAARMNLEEHDPAEWLEAVLQHENPRVAVMGIIALNKLEVVQHDRELAERVCERILALFQAAASPEDELDLLRCMTLTFENIPHDYDSPSLRQLGELVHAHFPAQDSAHSRELARVMVRLPTAQTREQLLTALEQSAKETDPERRADAIHYARRLTETAGLWDAAQLRRALRWFDEAESWTGGILFQPRIALILDRVLTVAGEAEWKNILREEGKYRRATIWILNHVSREAYIPLVEALLVSPKTPSTPRRAAIAFLAKVGPSSPKAPDLERLLLGMYEGHRSQDGVSGMEQECDDLIMALAQFPSRNTWMTLANGAALTHDPTVRNAALTALRQMGGHSPAGERKDQSGVVQTVKGEKKWTYDEILHVLRSAEKKSGSPEEGQKVFELCAKCHRRGAVGQSFGPDLTTLRSTQADLLRSIIDPSASITRGYETHIVATRDGQVITGFVVSEDQEELIMRLEGGNVIRIPLVEIEDRKVSPTSAMPVGLLNGLTEKQIIDLFAFLQSSEH